MIREEGSNGDREMASALHMAGFEVWDVNMHDISSGNVSLEPFRGIVFVGGFSYADVFGSAKGTWGGYFLLAMYIQPFSIIIIIIIIKMSASGCLFRENSGVHK